MYKRQVVIHRDPEFEALNMLGEAGRQAILDGDGGNMVVNLSLIHISEPTRPY